MAQFDVHRVAGGALVVDCQSDLLRGLPTRLVAPLRRRDGSQMERLTPSFTIDGEDFIMITPLAGAIAARDLGERVTSLAAQEYAIKDALDMLISGF